MAMKRDYFSLVKNENEATINIYGDIASWAWEELGEMSSNILSKQLESLGDVSKINVYINSYGGEVAEGLAIYNALRRHNAKVITYCDGFACSIASVIFMAGDERVMNEASLLMIHNAWTNASGNYTA
jgi:ATP-dependent Clp protease protease subunit